MPCTPCSSLFLAVPLLLSAVVYGQQPAPAAPALQHRPTAAGSANIPLDVVVTANNGTVVAGLKPQDFKLFDNGTPVPITSFSAVAGSSAPLEVLLVVDTVNVPYTVVSSMRGQIDKFLRANSGQLTSPVALAIFGDTGMQIQPGFSRDGNAEAQMLDHAPIDLRDIHRSAGFQGAAERLDSSIAAMRHLTSLEAARPGRKLIIWISPGWPLLADVEELDTKQQNEIFADVVGLSTAMMRGGITLYEVDPIGPTEGVGQLNEYKAFLKGVAKPSDVSPGDLALQVFATQSGGLVLTSSNDLVDELQQCMADATAYYAVSFTPAPSEPRDPYHSLTVKMAQPGLTARTWTGYYAK